MNVFSFRIVETKYPGGFCRPTFSLFDAQGLSTISNEWKSLGLHSLYCEAARAIDRIWRDQQAKPEITIHHYAPAP